MPRFIHWFLRFSILNPICIRLVGSASRRRRDAYIRSGFIAILAAVLFFGLLAITSGGRFSLRELAAGSASVFSFLAVIELLLICVLTPIFMAGAISKEANPRTWDIVLTTPMSPLQIVLGNLFGRLFFIFALLLGALPIMIVTQFFGGVPLQTILLTQVVAIALALIVATIAIVLSVTRIAGQKAAVTFFIITVLYVFLTYAIDTTIRTPVITGASATWTTVVTPLNPFLVLEALLQPSGYVIPESSSLPWPLGWLVTHPVSGWVWIACCLTLIGVTWSSLQVRKLGDRPVKKPFMKKFFDQEQLDREPHTVSGNPIAWRERVTRHRNLGSLVGRWGFVSLFGLTSLILTIFFLTSTIRGETLRDVSLYLILGEILIVIFTSITLSASAIAKEREDGSLDLLLTTSMTPRTYLGGKIKGLVLHVLPMALVPCCTMILMGLLVLIKPDVATVSDLWNSTGGSTAAMPMALFVPALLFPFLFIPYIAFCMSIGLLWSMRSRGTIGAMVTTLIVVIVLTGGVSICVIPIQQIELLGIGCSALSPILTIFVTLTPATTIPNDLAGNLTKANVTIGVALIVSGFIWSVVTLGLLRSMASSFVVTVRRLAGIH